MGWGTRSTTRMEWVHASAESPWPEVRILVESSRGPFSIVHESDNRGGPETQYTTRIVDKNGGQVAAGRTTVRDNRPKGAL